MNYVVQKQNENVSLWVECNYSVNAGDVKDKQQLS